MPDQQLPTPTSQAFPVPQDFPVTQGVDPQPQLQPQPQTLVQPQSPETLPLQGQVLEQPLVVSQPVMQRPLAAMNAMLSEAANQEDSLNPANPMSFSKEQIPPSQAIANELPSGMQSVEQLRSVEIAPEIEKYIEEVREDISHFPQEVVISDQQMPPQSAAYLAKPVIVLPMTQQAFEDAGKAPPTQSKRWLKEWIDKIKAMFPGSVIFRDE